MDKVTSLQEIQNEIKLIKENHKEFITNFYLEVDKINAWIKKDQFNKIILGDTVFFIKEELEFSHLFYSSASIEALNYSLAQLRFLNCKTHFVADIIGKEPFLQLLVQTFEDNGFYLYTVLNRMSRSNAQHEFKNPIPGLMKAEMFHAEAILNLLHLYFDPLAEQIPTLEEINNWIKLNHLILFEESEEILGFVIFDIIGVTSYLRYWFVNSQHRNRKFGSALINEYFKNSAETKRQLFWVIQSNLNAISRYLHYGFQSENLYDYIMTNKNVQYETTDN